METILSKEEREEQKALRLIREYGLVSLDPLDNKQSYRQIAIICGLIPEPEPNLLAVEKNEEVAVE